MAPSCAAISGFGVRVAQQPEQALVVCGPDVVALADLVRDIASSLASVPGASCAKTVRYGDR